MDPEQERQQQRSSTTHTTTTHAETTPAHGGGTGIGSGHIPAVAPTAETTASIPTASEQAHLASAPAPGGPEIEATEVALGKRVVDDMNDANGVGTHSSKIHYWYNYKRHCEQTGKPWKDEYRRGHAFCGDFVNPSENGKFMDFELKKGHSASKALKAWLAGDTVAECLSSLVAMEIDALRAAIGDTKFDSLFGSDDPAVDAGVRADKRMHIKAGTQGTPIAGMIEATDVAQRAYNGEKVTMADLDKDLVAGHWYYFYNHPKYLLKHPGGAWQGENALYMGKNGAGERIWAGLGASNMTEDSMIEEMVSAYNAPRTAYDEEVMASAKNPDGSYKDTRYQPGVGFKETITRKELLEDPAYELNGRERKGGFKMDSGMQLNEDKVKKLRG